MYSLQWLEDAQTDLYDLSERLKDMFDEKVARKSVSEIIETISTLTTFPNIGTPHTTPNNDNRYRVIHSKHNRIFYRIIEDTIQIIAIFDNRKNDRMVNVLLTQRIINKTN